MPIGTEEQVGIYGPDRSFPAELPGSEPPPVAVLQAWPKEQTLLQVSRAVIALQDLSFASRASQKNWR
jgi:hypothetical protein